MPNNKKGEFIEAKYLASFFLFSSLIKNLKFLFMKIYKFIIYKFYKNKFLYIMKKHNFYI